VHLQLALVWVGELTKSLLVPIASSLQRGLLHRRIMSRREKSARSVPVPAVAVSEQAKGKAAWTPSTVRNHHECHN
jgi:hypothetical protein